MPKVPIEKTYTLLKTYLDNKKYLSAYPNIDNTTQSGTLTQFIDEFRPLDTHTLDSNASPGIDDLDKRLDEIVYISTLSFFYVSATGKLKLALAYNRKRLNTLRELANTQHKAFRNSLQLSIKNSATKNEALETLTENYIKYLNTVENAEISRLSQLGGGLIGISFTEIKIEAKNKCSEFRKLLETYRSKKEEDEDVFLDAEEGEELDVRKKEEVADEDEDVFFDAEEALEKSEVQGSDLSGGIKKEKVAVDEIEKTTEKNRPQSKNIFFRFIEFLKNLFNRNNYKPSPSHLLSECPSPNLLSSSVVQCPVNNNSLTVNGDEQPTWEKRLTPSTVSGNPHAMFSNSASASNSATSQKANSNSDNPCWKKYMNTKFF